MRKFSTMEKVLTIFIIFVVLFSACKSLYFDTYKTENKKELEAIKYVEEFKNVPKGFFISGKVVSVKEYKEKVKGKELKYGYKIKYRDYLFYIIPFREWSILV